jgi:SNF2 family DNA or RNA helicase
MTAKKKAISSAGTWEVVNDELVCKLSHEIVFSTAEEIYSLVFEEKPIRDLPSIVSGNDSMEFSPNPASLEIHLTSAAGDPTNIHWSLAAVADTQTILISEPLSRRSDHVVIKDVWYPFPRGELLRLRKVLDEISVAEEGRITLRQYLELRKRGAFDVSIKDYTGGITSAGIETSKSEDDRPDGLVGELYPYQRKGWKWLALIEREGLGGILADEMGLGKTLQVIALLLTAWKKENDNRTLIIATGTLLENWRRELKKFAPSLTVLVHHGARRTGFPTELTCFAVVVTSYETAANDVGLLRQINWNIVVLDEAQAIKNPATKRAIAVKRLHRRVGIAVTGTPVENRLSDLWSIMDFVLPGYLGPQQQFERKYADDLSGAEALKPNVSPILLRRTIKEVATDLPERIEIPQALELEPIAARKYEELRKSILEEYGEAGGLVALTKLRMFCAHPFVLERRDDDPAELSPKYARLMEILEEIIDCGQKALVFTSFQEMTDILTLNLPRRWPAVWCDYIDGRKPISQRQTVIDLLTQHKGAGVLVLNPRAAGVGLNISAANHVIHYNLEWNPAVEDQASARAYRRGQSLPVTIHRLFYVDTVEEIIDDRLTKKRQLAQTAVTSTNRDDDLGDLLIALRKSPVKHTYD